MSLGVTTLTRKCSIPVCDLDSKSRGWCHGHYMRWYKTGDAGESPLESRRAQGSFVRCSFEDCPNDVRANGLCSTHYNRKWKHGDPSITLPNGRAMLGRLGEKSPRWQGSAIGYDAAHVRVRVVKGRAADHSCIDCGRPAADWSYIEDAPNELVTDRGYRYSPDPDFYVPRCKSCHKRYDDLARSE